MRLSFYFSQSSLAKTSIFFVILVKIILHKILSYDIMTNPVVAVNFNLLSVKYL